MKDVVFRPATSDDTASVAELLESLGYPKHISGFRPVFEQALQDHSLKILLAEQDQACLGLLTLLTSTSLRLGGPLVAIEELVVHPAVRGRKLGGRLVEQAKEHARRCGAAVLEVHTTTSRESFKRQFYVKNGFVLAESCVLRWKPVHARENPWTFNS